MCQRMLNFPDEWQTELLKCKIEMSGQTTNENNSIFDPVEECSLEVEQQLRLICMLPNFSKWLWNLEDPSKQQIKFPQKFSTSSRWGPGSPRNRIINAVVRNAKKDIVIEALHTMLSIYKPIEVSCCEQARKRKRPNIPKSSRLVIDPNFLCDSLGVDANEVEELSKNLYNAESQQLYASFVEKIFSSGKINWRVKNSSTQVILMNNYDPETGEFKVRYQIIWLK